MAENNFKKKEQKLLSFTDNRQDAALQTGHFNDYINVVRLRSAIYRALLKKPDNSVNHANLGSAIFDVLNQSLQFNNWANLEIPPTGTSTLERYQNVFKTYLTYRALYDLRRGWRVILPNLEQCGLLRIEYQDLEENVKNDSLWSDITLLNQMEHDERHNFLHQVLEYFRLSYALYSEEYLTDDSIGQNSAKIKEHLRDPWRFSDDEKIQKPFFLTYATIKKNSKLYTKSMGLQSYLGKYIKDLAKKKGLSAELKGDLYKEFIKSLMDRLAGESYLKASPAKDNENNEVSIYQLNIVNLIWKAGDKKTIPVDRITNRSYKENYAPKPNKYFQTVYELDFSKIKNLYAGDHTGQLSNDDRKDREERFKSGDMSVMYCSPTMELGIDIASLNIVHLRNAPPNPANYAQRSGRAGRSGQAALVITYCSSYSSHDRHYFANATDLVAGTVAASRIDLCNEELLKSHLYATVISEIGLEELNNSAENILNLQLFPAMPLREEIIEKLKLTPTTFDSIKNIYRKVIHDFKKQLEEGNNPWFSDNWIDIALENFTQSFDSSFDRWRNLYIAADKLLDDSTHKIRRGRLKPGSKEYKLEESRQKQAVRKQSLLCNDRIGALSFSEFYPYRYLASEGFLPGYNFTRLPMRTFIPKGDGGEYISRPRSIALREFGPGNRIYHSGAKYVIKQLIVQDAENQLLKAKICKSSGYFLMKEDFDKDVCPLTGASIQNNEDKEILFDLIEMSDTNCEIQSRITCEEEERVSQGYDISTYFQIDNFNSLTKANVEVDNEELLHLRFIPAMRLIHINKKWTTSKENGFSLGLTTGFWKKTNQDREASQEVIRNVMLYTSNVADALYIEPTEPLGLDFNGVITLQYALKKAIENRFQAESSEIGVTTLGGTETPNILIYEAAEGSLGILSQLVKPPVFTEVIKEAIRICDYDNSEYEEPASYNDLLSYYNQRFHRDLDRFLIKDALTKLKTSSIETQSNSNYDSYDAQYESLKEAMDTNSSTEAKFLNYLYKNNLRLPDSAQKTVEGVFVRPDFFYEPNIHIFCDGTPHDRTEVKEDDEIKRQQMMSMGLQVLVYYYKDNLDDLIKSRPDIFTKMR